MKKAYQKDKLKNSHIISSYLFRYSRAVRSPYLKIQRKAKKIGGGQTAGMLPDWFN
jgi:hypothetical protein